MSPRKVLSSMRQAKIDQVQRYEETIEALRRAEQKYRSIFENATEGIFQTTPEGKYLSANPALARMYGYDSPGELLADLTDSATSFMSSRIVAPNSLWRCAARDASRILTRRSTAVTGASSGFRKMLAPCMMRLPANFYITRAWCRISPVANLRRKHESRPKRTLSATQRSCALRMRSSKPTSKWRATFSRCFSCRIIRVSHEV